MIKKSWPWIGSTEKEMGAGESSREMDSQNRGDSLSIGGGSYSDPEPLVHKDGIQSPLTNQASDSRRKKKKKVNIDIQNKNGEDMIASFSCDIAKDMQDKILGLQHYDHLADTSGLLFEYENPEDVVYHMGTVKFPIDIIFIDNSNKIKKSYRNIHPGTLGTFGCANVKNVLEICGGLCDRLGISDGSIVSFDYNEKNSIANKFSQITKASNHLGINKGMIVKYSSSGINTFHNWKDFPILHVNTKIVKTAKKQNLLSDFISKNLRIENKKISIFDFDGIIERSPMIRLYKTSSNTNSEKIYTNINGHTATIVKKAGSNNEIYKDFHISEILNRKFKDDITIISSLNKSYSNFMKEGKEDVLKMFSKIREANYSKDSKVVLATRFPNPTYLKDIIASNYNLYYGEYPNIDIIQINKDADVDAIVDAARFKYGNQEYKIYSDSSLLKRAGLPIPNSTKESAKDAYKKLDTAYDMCKDSLMGLKNNVDAYTKVSDNPKIISSSKGQYNQSAKNNKAKYVKILENIRDAVKILNLIADSTNTPQLIESLTASSKAGSESIEALFSLVEKIDSPDFVNILTEKTTAYEKAIEDLQSSIDASRKHIHSDILGYLVFSE